MNKQVNIDMYNIFKYDYVFINDFNKPLFLQLKNINCRNKKDIATFINSSSCSNLDSLSKFLAKYNLDVLVMKRYVNFECGIIDTKSTILRKKTIKISIPSATDIANNVVSDNKYSDLD